MAFRLEEYRLSSSASRNGRAVFSFWVGDHPCPWLDIAVASHKSYSEVCDADYFFFTDFPWKDKDINANPVIKYYCKIFFLGSLSSYYEVLYLDADVIISSHAPSLFGLYADSKASFIALNEVGIDPEALAEEVRDLSLFYGVASWTPSQYYNTGVFLARNDFIKAIKVPEKLFCGRWWDQSYINFFLHVNRSFSTLDIDERFNALIAVLDSVSASNGYFYHFAGIFNGPGQESWRAEAIVEFCLVNFTHLYPAVQSLVLERSFTRVLSSLPLQADSSSSLGDITPVESFANDSDASSSRAILCESVNFEVDFESTDASSIVTAYFEGEVPEVDDTLGAKLAFLILHLQKALSEIKASERHIDVLENKLKFKEQELQKTSEKFSLLSSLQKEIIISYANLTSRSISVLRRLIK